MEKQFKYVVSWGNFEVDPKTWNAASPVGEESPGETVVRCVGMRLVAFCNMLMRIGEVHALPGFSVTVTSDPTTNTCRVQCQYTDPWLRVDDTRSNMEDALFEDVIGIVATTPKLAYNIKAAIGITALKIVGDVKDI